MSQSENRPDPPTPKHCGSYKAGHETHYIPATKVYIRAERFPVEIRGPIEDGWFTVSDATSSQRWWHHDTELLEYLAPTSAQRVDNTTYLVVDRRWLHAAREPTECPVWVGGVAIPRLKPV